MKLLLSLISAVLLSAFSLNANAWGKGGHMMVAYIAYERLNVDAKKEADRLLAIPIPLGQPTDFVSASYWADDVRHTRQYAFSKPYHFIDYFFSPDHTDLPGNVPEFEDILLALNKYVAMLRDSTASDESKAEALRFVIHFVGDISQPLHCVSRVTKNLPNGDRGGNDFPIRITDENGHHKTSNLHRYWDDGMEHFPRMGPNFAAPPMEEIPPAAQKAVKANPESSTAWRRGTPYDYERWAMESNRIATTFAYKDVVEHEEPSSQYEHQAFEIAETRIAWAGV